jgi:hypothetical protein
LVKFGRRFRGRRPKQNANPLVSLLSPSAKCLKATFSYLLVKKA